MQSPPVTVPDLGMRLVRLYKRRQLFRQLTWMLLPLIFAGIAGMFLLPEGPHTLALAALTLACVAAWAVARRATPRAIPSGIQQEVADINSLESAEPLFVTLEALEGPAPRQRRSGEPVPPSAEGLPPTWPELHGLVCDKLSALLDQLPAQQAASLPDRTRCNLRACLDRRYRSHDVRLAGGVFKVLPYFAEADDAGRAAAWIARDAPGRTDQATRQAAIDCLHAILLKPFTRPVSAIPAWLSLVRTAGSTDMAARARVLADVLVAMKRSQPEEIRDIPEPTRRALYGTLAEPPGWDLWGTAKRLQPFSVPALIATVQQTHDPAALDAIGHIAAHPPADAGVDHRAVEQLLEALLDEKKRRAAGVTLVRASDDPISECSLLKPAGSVSADHKELLREGVEDDSGG